jgi:hypothetical protein
MYLKGSGQELTQHLPWSADETKKVICQDSQSLDQLSNYGT